MDAINNSDLVVVKYLVKSAQVVDGCLQPRPVGFEEIVKGYDAKKMIATKTVRFVCHMKDMEELS